jgi:hypothetical protein
MNMLVKRKTCEQDPTLRRGRGPVEGYKESHIDVNDLIEWNERARRRREDESHFPSASTLVPKDFSL